MSVLSLEIYKTFSCIIINFFSLWVNKILAKMWQVFITCFDKINKYNAYRFKLESNFSQVFYVPGNKFQRKTIILRTTKFEIQPLSMYLKTFKAKLQKQASREPI